MRSPHACSHPELFSELFRLQPRFSCRRLPQLALQALGFGTGLGILQRDQCLSSADNVTIRDKNFPDDAPLKVLRSLRAAPTGSASVRPGFTISGVSTRQPCCDAGIPVHTVAQRIGDDPAVLLELREAQADQDSRRVAVERYRGVRDQFSRVLTRLGAKLGPRTTFVHGVLDLPPPKCLIPLQRKGGRVV